MAKSFLTRILHDHTGGKPFSKKGLSTAERMTRIDARTEGYPAEGVENYVEWRGMSPVQSTDDQWRVIVVRETANNHLHQVPKHHQLTKITEVSDIFSFEDAVNRLAVWEMARMSTGGKPVLGHSSLDLGKRHYKEITLQRGFLVATNGKMAPVADTFPLIPGTYLRGDIERFDAKSHSVALLEDFILHNPDTVVFGKGLSLDDHIEIFGAMNILKKMAFFAEILSEYSKVKLAYVNHFYSEPSRMGSENRFGKIFNIMAGGKTQQIVEVNNPDFYKMLQAHAYFSPPLLEEFNALRRDMADAVFKAFHVDPDDWDKDLDFSSRELQASIRADEGASETYDALHKDIAWPIDESEEDALLFISARSLVYLHSKLEENPAYELLINNGHSHAIEDVTPVLNYLDILGLKKMYIDLARGATVLAQTQEFKKHETLKVEFHERVASLRENLEECGHLSSGQVGELDKFISSRSAFYMIEMVEMLASRMIKAIDWLAGETLPKPHQLSLDLPLMHIKNT